MNTTQPIWTQNEVRGVMIAITLLTGTELFLSSAVPVILPDLAGPLGASADETSWALTLYSAGFLIAVPLALWLAKRVGHGRCMTYAAGAFTLSTLGLALSVNLEMFLVLRFIEGLAGGMFLVRSQITIYNVVPRQFLPYVLLWFCIGAYGLRALGSWYGGWIDDTISWRWVFLGSTGLSYVAWQWSGRYLRALQTNDDSEPDSIHTSTLAVLAVSLVSLQYVLSRGELDDWFGSTQIQVLSGTALCGLLYAYFCWRRYVAQVPHLDRRHRPSLIAGLPLSFLMGILLSGALATMPSFLRSGDRHSATQVGWLLMVDAGSSAVFIVFCIKWCLTHYKNRNTLIIGALLLSGGMYSLSTLLTSSYPDWIFIAPFLIRGGVIGIFVPALDYGTQVRIDRPAIPFSSTTYYLFRALGQSAGTTLVARTIDTRMSLHASRLGEHVSALNAPYLGYGQSAHSTFAGVGLSAASASQATFRDSALAFRQQALVLATADGMLFIAAVGLFFAVLAWLTFDRDIDSLRLAGSEGSKRRQEVS